MTRNHDTQGGNPGRRQLVLIVLISVLSLGGSYSLFYSTSEGGVWGTTNQGQFVTPALTVADAGVTDATTGSSAQDEIWWVWVVVDQCDAHCDTALHQLRQLHVLLNKDASRLRRGLVLPRGVVLESTLGERYSQLHLLQQADPPRLSNGIYIVDPLGNLVLTYALADAGKPVLQDLKRLLKLSQIG